MSGRSDIPAFVSDVHDHANDCEWVSENIEVLFDTLKEIIRVDHLFVEASEILNLIFPCIIIRDDYLRWEPILMNALDHASKLKDNDALMQILTQLAHNWFKMGLRNKAYETFTLVTERGEDFNVPLMTLVGKIGQLKTHAFFDRGYFNDLVKDVLKLARQIDESRIYGTVYSALALAYVLRGETRKALGYGQTAYAWWRSLQDDTQCGDVALTISDACRWALLINQADCFLQLAEKHLRGTHHVHKLGVLAYNKGIWYLAQKSGFQEAENWLQIALNNFNGLDFPYLTNAAHHAIALAQIRLGKHEDARHNLQIALIKWRELHNQYEVANVSHALGFLYYHLQNHQKARRWYDRSIRLCEKIPTSPLLQRLVENVYEDLSKLNGTGLPLR